MIAMTQQEMIDLVSARIKESGSSILNSFNMLCISSGEGKKWSLVLDVKDFAVIRMKSQREETRTFANLDSAHKVATSIVNHMNVIGK